jgi:ankyrin repeat protein
VEAVRLCLEHGANVNAADANGVTPLHDAVVRARSFYDSCSTTARRSM